MEEKQNQPNQSVPDSEKTIAEEKGVTTHNELASQQSIQEQQTKEIIREIRYEKKKEWKEHLFEFMMLFLAVFAGFIADNIRESYVDRQHEKEYMHSLMQDLQGDTAYLYSTIKDNEQREQDYDSLLSIMKRGQLLKNTSRLYYYFIPTTYYELFSANERTIQQLENSGELRVIKDITVSDSITKYYQDAKGVIGQGDTYLKYFDIYHQQAFTVFDYSQIDTNFFNPEVLLDSEKNYSLLSTDNVALKELYSKLFIIRAIMQLYINDLKRLNIEARQLLNYLRQQYA